jgi:hypothetical protein
MTDDKVAGEGPYDHILASNKEWCVFYCPECAYQAGRKAERERCAKIAEMSACQEVVMGAYCITGKFIAEKIRGAQDGK